MKLIDLLVQELPKQGGWPTASEGLALPLAGNDLVTSWRFNSELDLFVTCTYGSEVVTREEYEAAIAASQQPAWNGEGLPPVGCEVEYAFIANYREQFSRGEVIAYGAEKVFMRHGSSQNEFIHQLDKVMFRPISTEEDRKRHETLYALEKLDIDSDVTIRVLEAITAGIIPHITLK